MQYTACILSTDVSEAYILAISALQASLDINIRAMAFNQGTKCWPLLPAGIPPRYPVTAVREASGRTAQPPSAEAGHSVWLQRYTQAAVGPGVMQPVPLLFVYQAGTLQTLD